jgi:hypothetical protein
MRHRNQRGQGLVEIALVLPLFLLALFGLVDIGRAVFAYSTLTNSVDAGARAGIVRHGPGNACVGMDNVACAKAVTAGNAKLAFTDPVRVTAECMEVTPCKIGARLRVVAEGDIHLITPLAAWIGPIRVNVAETRMYVEAVAP